MKDMKHHRAILGLCGTMVFSGCADFETPFSGGSFDPLSTAGYRQQGDAPKVAGNYEFIAGQFVTAASNSTAFFSKKPSGNAEADELLAAGTTMRVIKSEDTFVKVELDNGKVGYVAAALLLESQQSPEELVPAPLGGESGETLPAALQPELAPADRGNGAPTPPISNELPPSSLDSSPSTAKPLPEPSKGGTLPQPPLGQ
ncbi:MAG: hypothetical protein RI957_474 [Verrucomicrobiota bacterium]|jgi:hypothetical protein